MIHAIKVLSILICSSIGFLSTSYAAVSIQVRANSIVGQYLDSDGATLPDGSVMRIGLFDVSALNNLTPSELLDYNALNSIFTEWTSISSASGNFLSLINSIDLLPSSQTNDPVFAWVFNAALPTNATAYGVFTASGSPAWTVPADNGSLIMNAADINEVRVGSTDASSPTNYLLTPVPEPASYAAFLGLVGLCLAAWRRRR